MPLPPAPATAVQFMMAGPTEIVRAREVPSADALSGPLRAAAADVRKAVRVYDEIKASGRKLLDTRSQVHAQDERAAAEAMGAGKPMPGPRLLAHDDQLADAGDRLSAAAGAVVAAVGELEAIPEDQWARAAGKVAGEVAEHVGAAEDALATARAALKSVDGIAGVLAWTQRRGTTRHHRRVSEALDAVDRAQEFAVRVRDGDPAPDPNLISPPAHPGRPTSARIAAMDRQ